MNRQILDSLIQDESIRSLLEKSADAYWLSEIYDYNLGMPYETKLNFDKWTSNR